MHANNDSLGVRSASVSGSDAVLTQCDIENMVASLLIPPPRPVPWVWSQLTLAHNTLVGLSKILYLIFKFAVALW
jgi:hypothetical protein